ILQCEVTGHFSSLLRQIRIFFTARYHINSKYFSIINESGGKARMIIVLKPHTSEENITRVENLVKNLGLDTHVVRGTEMTIIGCIGDTTLIDPRLFEVDSSVDKVMHVQEPYKLANRAFHPEDSVVDVSGVKFGGGHMGLIAGPCSVESFEQVLEIAQAAKASGATMLRGGAF